MLQMQICYRIFLCHLLVICANLNRISLLLEYSTNTIYFVLTELRPERRSSLNADPRESQGRVADRSASRMSVRSVASTSYAVPAGHSRPPSIGSTRKPKRSLTFKQRLKNLKDNLMYSADIKYCRKRGDLNRMNSVRSSIRSGRSPYANDYDETDALISSSGKKPKQRRARNRQPSTGAPSRPATTEGRSRPVTPESRSRPVTPESKSRPVTPDSITKSMNGPSRPVTPMQRSRPASPESRPRPVPLARSRPPSPEAMSPEAKSRPTTPGFRQGGKAPSATYFRPRTPSAATTDETPVYSPTSPTGWNGSTPLIRPVPQRVKASYQDSPRSSFRSQQTLL